LLVPCGSARHGFDFRFLMKNSSGRMSYLFCGIAVTTASASMRIGSGKTRIITIFSARYQAARPGLWDQADAVRDETYNFRDRIGFRSGRVG